MKPRIKVKNDGGVTTFLSNQDCTVEQIREIYSGRSKKDFEREIKELRRMPTVYFSTIEAAIYTAIVVIFVIASLSWTFCEVSKL